QARHRSNGGRVGEVRCAAHRPIPHRHASADFTNSYAHGAVDNLVSRPNIPSAAAPKPRAANCTRTHSHAVLRRARHAPRTERAWRCVAGPRAPHPIRRSRTSPGGGSHLTAPWVCGGSRLTAPRIQFLTRTPMGAASARAHPG